MKTVMVDYGAGQVPIEVPETAFVTGKPNPPALEDPEAAVRAALAAPVGMGPIRDWVKPGAKVTIAFDDPTRPALPRQVAIPVIIEQLRGGRAAQGHHADQRRRDASQVHAQGAARLPGPLVCTTCSRATLR